MCVCVCVCVKEREMGGVKKPRVEREGGRGRGGVSTMSVIVKARDCVNQELVSHYREYCVHGRFPEGSTHTRTHSVVLIMMLPH